VHFNQARTKQTIISTLFRNLHMQTIGRNFQFS
jgi:hypothetical protein